MSKAIVILEMPDSCSECKFLDDSSDYPRCIVNDETQGYRFNAYAERMNRCPLLDVNSETTEDPHSLATDFQDAKHGEWIWKRDGHMKYLHCSCCGMQGEWETEYCHNCGAKMDRGRKMTMSNKFNRSYKMAKDEFGVTVTPKKSNGETFESLFGETTGIIIDREKQIEEIAKVMCGGCPDNKECTHCLCADWYKAESLYNAGYRKRSEVAMEISRDIIEPIWEAYKNSSSEENALLVALICEGINTQLKNKYTEESGNG